jgi:hypothetical protein
VTAATFCALTAALTAAVDAGVVTRWRVHADAAQVSLWLGATPFLLAPDQVPAWLADRVRYMGASTSRFLLPAQHRAWSVLLDRLGDLAETLPWWTVAP